MTARAAAAGPGVSRRRFLGTCLWAGLAVGALPLATACQGASPGASPTAAPAATGSAAEAADVAKAKQEGMVMLYTSLDTQIVDAVIKPFKERYGIDVQYFRGGSADVSGRVLAEADAGKVQADIVDASDVGAFLAMKQRGLLKPYDPPATRSVAANLRDPDNHWVADRLTQAVIQYNTTLVTGADVPRHWKDLADTRFQGKLTYFSSSNGDGAPRLYTLAKAFGWDLLEGFATTGPLRVQTPQLVTQTLENGERAVGFAQNDNIALRSKQQGKPTDYLFPDEGVPTEPGALGLIQNASHPNAAMLLYDWWMGDAGQTLLVDGGKYSSRSDLPPPSGSPALKDLKVLVLDYNEFQEQRPQILKRMAQVFGGTWG